jgi:hypothetical protein
MSPTSLADLATLREMARGELRLSKRRYLDAQSSSWCATRVWEEHGDKPCGLFAHSVAQHADDFERRMTDAIAHYARAKALARAIGALRREHAASRVEDYFREMPDGDSGRESDAVYLRALREVARAK